MTDAWVSPLSRAGTSAVNLTKYLRPGRRLADLLPRGRLIEIPDSYTLIVADQPAALAGAIRAFETS